MVRIWKNVTFFFAGRETSFSTLSLNSQTVDTIINSFVRQAAVKHMQKAGLMAEPTRRILEQLRNFPRFELDDPSLAFSKCMVPAFCFLF